MKMDAIEFYSLIPVPMTQPTFRVTHIPERENLCAHSLEKFSFHLDKICFAAKTCWFGETEGSLVKQD